MPYGYNMQLTPLQTLAFYNAIANNGQLIKPRFLRAVKEFDRPIEIFEKEVLVDKLCSNQTLSKIKEILKNIVVRGTGKKLYSESFSMAGKTGTARTDYANYEEWRKDPKYVSSFAGYFPAENPKYSCIVVIHEPLKKKGYYGATVAAPVFKEIAQKIYTSTPVEREIVPDDFNPQIIKDSYAKKIESIDGKKVPNVKGMGLNDALFLLENQQNTIIIFKQRSFS